MKNLMMVALALVFAGCQTSQPQRVPDKPAPKQAKSQMNNKRLTAKQTARYLRVRVKVSASDGSAVGKKLADTVFPNVQQALCGAGFEVVQSGEAEMEVTGVAKCLDGIIRGNRTVCRGYLELTFTRNDVRNPVTGKGIRRVVNVKRFDAKSGEAWTSEEALMSLGDNLAASVGKWLREIGASMTDNLALCKIAVNSVDAHSQIEKDYPTEFTKIVLGIQGVYDCRITPLNSTRTMFTAGVLYDARQIPDGVLNRLLSMRTLNLE